MKKNDKVLKWLYKVPAGKRRYVLALILVQALVGATGSVFALLLRSVIDCAVAGDGAGFRRSLLLSILLVIGQISLRALIRWLNELSRSTYENLFKERLLDQLLRKNYASVSAVHSGEWLNRLTSDTVVVANGYVDILPGLAGMLVKLATALIMIVVLDARFACFLLPCGVLLILFTFLFRGSLKKLHRNVQEADGRLRVFLQERLGGMMVIHSFAGEARTLEEAAEKMGGHKSARMRKNRFHNFCNVGFAAAMNGMYLGGLGYFGYGILKGTVSFGTLSAVLQLIGQVQAPFADISSYLPRFYAMEASAERLMEAEAFADDIEGELMKRDEVRRYYREELRSFGLRGAAFTYYAPAETVKELNKEHMPTVLRDLTLSIGKGETVAFTGHSGCGKSTVLKLLMCMYRLDAGERYLQDKAGREQPLSANWRRLFAYVPQGNQLMSGSIRELVSFADPQGAGDEARLWSALEIACAKDFVSEQEKGLDTLLGERGAGLSEGQMQRLAIARAVFADSPVLLLDEATSALDEQTEKQLLENLRQLTDKTVLIVTHRPAALSICDRVIHFTEGGPEEV